MVFNSIEFLLFFLPIFLILYWMTPERFRNGLLFAASLIFYSFGEIRCLGLLLGAVLANYLIGRYLGIQITYGRSRKAKRKYYNFMENRRWVCFLALTGNVVLLAFFKRLGNDRLPLGISFYTFQMMAYLIDVYRREIPAERSLVKFGTYVTMFPQLISGPIVRYEEVRSALAKRRMTWRSVQDGLKLFTVGLAAKVLLADRIGLLWHDVQVRGIESVSTPLAWLGAFAYSLKIYFDFGGYSLMAVGLGGMLGFSLPENFKLPYMARSVREFYRRWHITLGKWFRRYIYIPLGGNRRGELRTVRNLLIVWLLTGLWHGSSANFLIWAMNLWALIAAERLIGGFLERHSADGGEWVKRLHLLPHLYLWLVIPVTWVCFAIPDVRELALYLQRMFGVRPQCPVMRHDWLRILQDHGVWLLLSLFACTPCIKKLYRKFRNSMAGSVILAALFWICVWRILEEGNNPFLYFSF